MADWPTIDELLAQEQELQLDRFTHDDAWALGSALVEEARARGAAVTIDIRLGDQQVFHYAFAGTAADNDEWVRRKVAVVRRFGHSSLWLGQVGRDSGREPEEIFALEPAGYAGHGGAFPLRVRGVDAPIGVVTVSGLPQLDDHAFVVEGLRRHAASAR